MIRLAWAVPGLLAGALLAWAGAVPATAGEPLPMLELGVGAGLLSAPDYSGSSEVRTTVLPVPYFAYRGERIQLSRDGLVARLFNTESVRLGVSASASLPGNGSQHGVRRGMPKLLPTFEIGPSLDWRLGEAGGHWDLQLPVRAVAAADFDEFEGIGWLAYPHLRYSLDRRLGGWSVEAAFGAGPVWASRKYHHYFYSVEPQYATAGRPAYEAAGGYSGARTTAFLGLRRGPWRVGLGISHDTLAGAVTRDSPLVETGHGSVIGAGVFYSLWTRDASPVPAASLPYAPRASGRSR